MTPLTPKQGQFFPYFILTVAGLVTGPLSYSLLKPSKGTHMLLRNTVSVIEMIYRS